MKIIQDVKNFRRFLKMDKISSPKRDLGMLKDGFFSKRRDFYPFERFHKSLFLTDWEIEFKFSSINNTVSQEKLKNKLFFQLLLKEAEMHHQTPGLIGILEDGKYQPFSDQQTLVDVFRSVSKIFVKPVSGAGGRECFIVEKIEDLPSVGYFLIEKCAVAHSYSKKIFPHSLNTIRLFTLKGRSGEPFIVGAAHRFGANVGSPIDNFSKGGVACGIDLDSGTLSSGVTNPGIYSSNFHDTHPTTHEQLTGVVIPFWQDVKELTIKLASHFHSLNYAGWDLCVSPTGPKIIEGNAGIANPNLIQAHSSLLYSEEVREQLLKFGVLSEGRFDKIKQVLES